MASRDDIFSTEKLLDLIRSKAAVPRAKRVPEPVTDGGPGNGKRSKRPRVERRLAAVARSMTVIGVDLRPQDFLMAAVQRLSDPHPVLADYQRVAVESDVSPDSQDYSNALRKALEAFSRPYRRHSIWTAMSSENVETRLVRVPKVSPKQLANAVSFAFQRTGRIQADQIFDFQVIGDTIEDGAPRILALAYTVSLNEVRRLRQIFSRAGYPLTGISIIPFGLQNIFRAGWTDTGSQNVCSLFIGRDWSRIAIFAGGTLALSRDIKAGMRSMRDAVIDALAPPEEPRMEGEAATERPVSAETVAAANRLLSGFIKTPDAAAPDPGAPELDVFERIRPAIDRIVRQVLMTNEHFARNFDEAGIERIFVSGQLSANPRIVEYMGGQLGLAVDTIDPFRIANRSPTLSPLPKTEAERGAYLPSIGMALSANPGTPNFLFTQKDRARSAMAQRINRVAYAAFIALMLGCAGVFFWQGQRMDRIRSMNAPLRAELATYSPRLSRQMIFQAAGAAAHRLDAQSKQKRRYLVNAVFSEIINRTPAYIELSGLVIHNGHVTASAIDATPADAALEGWVHGDRLQLESLLAAYLIELDQSPFLTQPRIGKKRFETDGDTTRLYFQVTVKVH